MSEPKLISPLLDNFIMGDAISDHHGVRCYPAMEKETDDRYIIKVISVPATPSQLDALLLSGAYTDTDSALDYFRQQAEGILREANTLEQLAQLEGFISHTGCQMEPMESGEGFDIYFVNRYQRTLHKHFKRHCFTHLDVLNLGLDLCAALSVCRRSGYLYADLKPSNVFVTDQRLFRIGDLGFVSLDSLKYASLPEKYLSEYTPPEVRDAFSELNTTMDTYAAGLILYQAYNNGQLPFNDQLQPGDELPAPLYADYEMSEIILKACAANPEDRWQDPTQMGQAIVSYMQRNGASDTPIVPAPEPEAEEAVETDAQQTEEPAETPPALQEPFEPEAEEDVPEDYEAITEEVTEMLEQADDLVAAPVPEPVVVPDHVEVPMPELPQPVEEETESEEQAEEETATEENPEEESVEETPAPKKKCHWLRNTLLAVLVLALLAGGIVFYKNYYLLPIDLIAIEGSEDTLTVRVTTDIDESLLQVICSDSYGNQLFAPVVDGKAEFTGLASNTAYSVKVVANGFHRLVGSSSTAYSTPVQTNIVQFDAVTGATGDSVILSFAVEGPDCEEWTVLYAAEGEAEQSATFSAHMVTLTGLAVGRDYTFRLVPSENLYVTGLEELTFTTRDLVKAENLQVVSCIDSALTIQWSVPEGESVSSWSVHCSNDSYDQTIITTEPTATFQGLDHTGEFLVEVKAAGMSISQTATVSANSITAANFTCDSSTLNKLVFTWEPSKEIPEEGWLLRYSVAGVDNEITLSCMENTATISPVIPNATYRVQLEDVKGEVLLGSKMEIVTPAAVDFAKEFSAYSVVREDMDFAMCRTPEYLNWGRYDLSDDDYTDTFTTEENISFLIGFPKLKNAPKEEVSVLYVIRDQDGVPMLSASEVATWKDMWSTNYCKMNVPVMPTVAGTYTVEIYLDGGLAHAQTFTVS